jgi:hypothetical protein
VGLFLSTYYLGSYTEEEVKLVVGEEGVAGCTIWVLECNNE